MLWLILPATLQCGAGISVLDLGTSALVGTNMKIHMAAKDPRAAKATMNLNSLNQLAEAKTPFFSQRV